MAGKNCHKTQTVTHGVVRDQQRYQGKIGGDHVVLGEARHPHATERKKAVWMIFSARGKASFGFLGTRVGGSRRTT